MDSRPILLVEDDSVDVIIMKRTLRELGVTRDVVCAADGAEALAYLKDAARARPCVILLDLNMPGMDGFQFLRAVKADDTLRDIPVVVVSTSGDAQDRNRSSELGAAGYVVKCLDYAVFRERIHTTQPIFTSGPRPGESDVT